MRMLLHVPVHEVKERIEALEEAMKSTDKVKQHVRYQIIRMILKGDPVDVVSDRLGVNVRTIYDYTKLYRKNGLEGLKIKPKPGRPKKLSKEQEQELADTVENKTPSDVGFSSEMNWTSPLIQEWVKKNFKIPVSSSHIRETLYLLNFSYTMPTYVLAKADPMKQVAFLEKFKGLREQVINGEIDKLLFVDESMIRDYQALSRIWFPVGKQKKVKTFGKHWGAKLIGSLDYETGEVFCRTYEQYTAKEFLSFLKSVVYKYRKKKITIILDNAKIHHAELIQPFLEEHKDVLTLVFLPPYNPNLNLIEGLWGWLKASVVNNVFFQSVKEIRAEVFKFVEKINLTPLETVDRLCLKLEKFMSMSNDAIIADLL